MSKSSIRIVHQGLILLAVPLVLEILLLGALLELTRRADREIASTAHAREVVLHCNALFNDLSHIGGALSGYNAKKTAVFRQRYEMYNRRALAQFEELSRLTANNPAEAAAIKTVRNNTDAIFAQMQMISMRDGPSDPFAMIKDIAQVKPYILGAEKGLDTLIESEQALCDKEPHAYSHAREAVIRWVVVAVVTNVLVALGLWMAFRKTVSDRMLVLVDNIRKFGRRECALAALEGTDELAEINASFKQMAQEVRNSEQRKNELMQMVAHDLRSPLTSVTLSLARLQEDAAGHIDERAREQVGKIHKQVGRLVQLINDLLEVENIESGKMTVQPRKSPLSWIVETSVDALQGVIAEKNINVDYPDEMPFVVADPERIVQVITNLLSNAVKFSPVGSTITIATQVEGKDVIVSMEDRGRGIPAHMITTVFEARTQVRAEDRKIGSGLGLSFCKSIIEAHGGKIGVESDGSSGSKFWFTLALANDEQGGKSSLA